MPAAVAGVLALGRLPVLAGAGVGTSVAGVVWCHPSAAVSIAVTTGAWWAGMLVAARGRSELRRAVRGVAVAAGVAAVLLVPAVSPGLGQSARTANWPPDTGPVPFYQALGETLGFPYSGGIDPEQTRAQIWVLLLVLVGIAAVVALRRGVGPVAAFAVWSAIVVGAWLSPGTGVDALVTRFFYHAMLRTWSHVYLLAPVLAGLGVVLVANRVAVLARRRPALGGSGTRPPPRSPPTRPGRRSGTPGSSNSRSRPATARPTSSGSVPTTTRRSPGWPRTSGRGSGSSTPRTTARPTSTSSAASRSSTSTPSA